MVTCTKGFVKYRIIICAKGHSNHPLWSDFSVMIITAGFIYSCLYIFECQYFTASSSQPSAFVPTPSPMPCGTLKNF